MEVYRAPTRRLPVPLLIRPPRFSDHDSITLHECLPRHKGVLSLTVGGLLARSGNLLGRLRASETAAIYRFPDLKAANDRNRAPGFVCKAHTAIFCNNL